MTARDKWARHCKKCGVLFETKARPQIYCSVECRRTYRSPNRDEAYVLTRGQLSTIEAMKAKLVAAVEADLGEKYPNSPSGFFRQRAIEIVNRRKYADKNP